MRNYHWNFEETLMINHSSVYHLLRIEPPQIPETYINYTAGSDAIILLRWESRLNRKVFSDVLMLYQWEIELCYHSSKIRDLMRNLWQNHSSFCDTVNMCTINLFVLSNLVPRVSRLSIGKKVPSFISKSQHALETRLCI